MTEPASIRYKNPGAMWPGSRATEWGSKEFVTLKDGQDNKIAVFPTFVQGAAAQFDLWTTSYVGMRLSDAIHKWSGHNSSASYAAYLKKHTGLSLNVMMTRALLSGDSGWKLLKAQSSWEAGKAIPMTDAEWQQAQAMVFTGAPQPASLPYLRLGDAGGDVAKMQTLLKKHGAKIEIDGRFGKVETLPALVKFQASVGLRDDGICGPLTWEKLGAEIV